MRVQTILCALKIALVFISSIFFYLLMIWGLTAIMPASSNDSNRHVELLIGWLVMLVSSWCFIKLKGMVEEIYKTMLSPILSVLSSLFFIVLFLTGFFCLILDMLICEKISGCCAIAFSLLALIDVVKRKVVLWIFALVAGLGIIMGALFPAGTDPFIPQSSAAAMRGRNLYVKIIQNNTLHEGGEMWCDPQVCSNSLEFIKGVINVIGTEGLDEHDIKKWVQLWNVAIDVPDDCDDLFPLMISANFNPKFLEGRSDDDEILPLGRKAKAQREPFNNKGIVVIRKSGEAHIIKAKHCTRKVILGDSVRGKCRVAYLTPNGRINLDVGFSERLDAPGGSHGR